MRCLRDHRNDGENDQLSLFLSTCRHLSSGMLQPVRHDATCRRQNFPRRLLRLLADQNSVAGRSSTSVLALWVHPSFPVCRLSPAITAFRKEKRRAITRPIPRRHRPPAPDSRQGDQPAAASVAGSASTSIRPRNNACAFAAGMPT
ncbi:hypothetical protein B5K04_31165 [Rhizobium phaseoli]|nr:hypothetical protein B5K04_31165 [Rhizobium phaseoli]